MNISLRKILALVLYKGGIFYEKISKVPKNVNGYNNLDNVLKRYEVETDLSTAPYKDLEKFLNYECYDLIKDFKHVNAILDIGCGNASYSLFFNKLNLFAKNLKYFGIEIDKKMVDLCKRKYPSLEFNVSKAENIDYEDKSFNMVFCSGTLHYTLNNWKKALGEMKRVTNKFILISRLPITKFNKSFFVHQTVLSTKMVENHYFKVINKFEFEDTIKSLGLKIYGRDYSSEIYNIDGIEEKIILSNYLLKRQ